MYLVNPKMFCVCIYILYSVRYINATKKWSTVQSNSMSNTIIYFAKTIVQLQYRSKGWADR